MLRSKRISKLYVAPKYIRIGYTCSTEITRVSSEPLLDLRVGGKANTRQRNSQREKCTLLVPSSLESKSSRAFAHAARFKVSDKESWKLFRWRSSAMSLRSRQYSFLCILSFVNYSQINLSLRSWDCRNGKQRDINAYWSCWRESFWEFIKEKLPTETYCFVR